MDATLPGDHALHLDSAAREEWVANCEAAYPAVYRALIAIGASEFDAADALQDAFEDALKQRRAVTSAQGWLFVVAVRSARRGVRLPSFSLERVRGRSGEGDIDALLDRMEVGRLLAGLTERQRAMVVAQFYLGLDHREIAAHFGVKTGTVSATLAQAKARMRAEVRNAS